VSDQAHLRWRKDNVQGETNDLVTDADVLYRAAEIVGQGGSFVAEHLRWLARHLESEPSTDGDTQP